MVSMLEFIMFVEPNIYLCLQHRYIHQRSQTSYTSPCNGVVSHRAQFGGLRVLATKHAKKNAGQMCSRSSSTVLHITRVCLHTQTTVYVHLLKHSYFDYGKTQDPQIEPHAGIKMPQVLGSVVYICG